MILVTKEFTFDAAHRLPWHQGGCGNLHGHTYKLQVTVVGELNKNDVVIDFEDLKNITQQTVINLFDHKYINDIISNPTAENMAIYIFNLLQKALGVSNTENSAKNNIESDVKGSEDYALEENKINTTKDTFKNIKNVKDIRLFSVKLWETPTSFVEIRRETKYD